MVLLHSLVLCFSSFTVCPSMAIITAVETLLDLILRSESFGCIVEVIDVEAIRDASVCSMWVVHIYDDGMV